jgi:hypothetical protein
MFFGNALADPFVDALATHPPLEQRIRAIDPNWDGKFQSVPEEGDRVEKLFAKPPPKAAPPIFNEALTGIMIAAGTSSPPPIRPNAVMPNLGSPSPQHLQYAEQLRDSLPENLKAAAREPLGAMALIYTLLLSQDDSQRITQLAGLNGRAPQAVFEQMSALYADVSQTASHARLPLVNLALPALRQLDAGQFSQFSQTLQWLIASDGEVELFEFVLQKIVLRHLAPKFNQPRPSAVQFYSLKPLVSDCAVVLSALANVGSSNPQEIQKAFTVGAPFLRAPADSGLLLLPAGQCGVDQVDAALNQLALAAPTIKKNLIEACAQVVAADGVIVENEAELLRAIADTLDCPIPPFIPAT